MDKRYDILEDFLCQISNQLDVNFCNCLKGGSYNLNGTWLALEQGKIILSISGRKKEALNAVDKIKSKCAELGFSVQDNYKYEGATNNFTIDLANR